MTGGVPKAMRIITGVMLMAAFVLVVGGVLLRYAGEWGVPYFSFQTDRGSTCKNDLTGYTCNQLTLADIEFFGDVDLPADTKVVKATYRSTHDYQLDAQLEVPKSAAAAAIKGLTIGFGRCVPNRPSPLETPGIVGLCVMTNDATVTADNDLSSRLYSVGTGMRKDGRRAIAMAIKSR